MADLSVAVNDSSGVHEDCGQDLILNGGFETVPTFTAVQTAANAWVDGSATGSASNNASAWGVPSAGITAAADCQFDTTVSHSGSASMKLETTNATGLIVVTSYIGSQPNVSSIIPAHSSMSYTFTAWCNTNNVPTNACWVDIREFSSSFSTLATNSTSKLSGTNGWTQLSKTFTTNASTTGIAILLRISVAGNVCQAWYDDLQLQASTPNGNVTIPVGVVVTAGIQDVSGPKIWS